MAEDESAAPEVRSVVLVLCTPDGEVLGATDPLPGLSPWWSSAPDVVDAAREKFGLEITVLRLLRVENETSAAACTWHQAQVDAVVGAPGPSTATATATAAADTFPASPTPGSLAAVVRAAVPLRPVPVELVPDLADHPLRLPYARPGGPGVSLAWADAALAARGTPRTGAPRQERTWNLSGIWALPTAGGPVWLKDVPPFFAHEGAVLDLVTQVSDAVPPLLAHEPGRVLLGDVPGQDLFRAPSGVLARMVPVLVGVQAALAERTADLLATGCFDWRSPHLEILAADVAARHADELDAEARACLHVLLDALADRLTEVEACGVPQTLVHGDFHPGNVRGEVGDGGRLVILDWGDAGIGHPLLDQAAFLEWVPAPDREPIAALWAKEWRRAVPGCAPERAAHLLAPVAALRQAVIYRYFLDRIEPTERVYHQRDPALWLTRAADLARREASAPDGGVSPARG